MTEAVPDSVRRTILVLAYSISPVRGSEYAVGWNYVSQMAGDNDLIVLYGLAGAHMGDLEEIASLPTDAFGGRVTFVPVLPDLRARIANHLNRTGHVPFSFYVAYRYWHLSALKEARRIIAERRIDVVHYLCPIGYREPGYLWKLDKPYIWGPIGGIALRPVRAFMGLGWKEGARTVVRNLVNTVQFRLSYRVRASIRAADILLAATSQNADAITLAYKRKPIVLPENAVATVTSGRRLASRPNQPLRLVWVGTLETRKALTIALQALALIDRPGRWSLDVVGEGPLLSSLIDDAVALGIDSDINWLGKVPREQAIGRFQSADLHVVTSLAEGHPTTIWEAMSHGVPTIAFDHCGMRDTLAAGGGIRLPLGSIASMIAALAAELDRLIDDRSAIDLLMAEVVVAADRFSWTRRIDFWNRTYEQAIGAHVARKGRR